MVVNLRRFSVKPSNNFDSMYAGFSKNKLSITKKLVLFHGYKIFQLYNVKVTIIVLLYYIIAITAI